MTKTKDDKGKSDRRVGGDSVKANGTELGKAVEEKAKPDMSAAASQDDDVIVQKGEEIASKRALMAQAFQPPCPEPEKEWSHRSHMLSEMKWLAIDVAQERLWKQSVALAISIEIARYKGDFQLRQPPADCRQYSDEIKQLKLEAAKASGQTTGRRSSKSAVLPAPAVLLELDTDNDPALKEIERGAELLKEQAKELGNTLDVVDIGDNPELTLRIDAETRASIENYLQDLENQRRIREEAQYRSYRMEYEAALASHQLAIAEQQAAANAIDAFEIGQSLDLDMIDDGLLGPPRKSYKRRRGGYGVDDFDDRKLDGYGDRRRAKQYRDDAEPNYSTEGGRYGRRVGAARNRKPLSDRNRNVRLGRPDGAYPSGRVQGQPGMLSWSRNEDELLLAIVHEFGVNWTLVSEVLSRSLSMHGIYRPSQQCRQRFRQLTMHEGQSLTDEKAYENLSSRLGKQQARDLLMASLPVRDEALVRFLEALAQVGASAKNRILAEEKRLESLRSSRQEPHVSYKTVYSGIMQHTGGRHLSPFELSAHVMSTLAAQRQIPQGGHAAAQGHVTGNPNQQGAAIESVNVAVQNAAAGQQPVQGTVRPTIAFSAQNVQHISAILANNKLPSGQELTDEMRKSLEAKRRMYVAKYQQEQAYALRGGMPNQPPAQGQPTGQITSGTTLGGVHPGMRPPAGVNIPGAQQGMPVGPGVQQMHAQMQNIPCQTQQQGQKSSSK